MSAAPSMTEPSAQPGTVPVSAHGIHIRVVRLEQEEASVPGKVCMGIFLRDSDALISMEPVMPAALEAMQRIDWANTPVRLALPAMPQPDQSIQATLCLLVPLACIYALDHPRDGSAADGDPGEEHADVEDTEPDEDEDSRFSASPRASLHRRASIADSAGSTRFEALMRRQRDGNDAALKLLGASTARFLSEGVECSLIPVGSIIRLPANREHPFNAHDEAHDMLRDLMQGRTMRVVDKIIENERL